MSDIVYCVNGNCPFTDCKRHSTHIPKFAERVSLASFDGRCRRYVRHLVNEVTNEMDIRKEK